MTGQPLGLNFQLLGNLHVEIGAGWRVSCDLLHLGVLHTLAAIDTELPR